MNANGSALEVSDSRGTAIEHALVNGDLAKLSTAERLSFYQQTCESLGLNHLTKPFAYITLNGKLTLYALRDCTDQLRKLHKVSITISSRERIDDVYVVTARATLPDGRADESTGAVAIANLKGDAMCNALMKAETKAKRRATLSIVGLGILDESEAETIPSARLQVEALPPEPIVELDQDAIDEWLMRFDTATSEEGVRQLQRMCKEQVKDQKALLQIGVAFKRAQKRVKEGSVIK